MIITGKEILRTLVGSEKPRLPIVGKVKSRKAWLET